MATNRGEFENLVGGRGHFRAVRHDDHATAIVMGQCAEDAHDVILRGEVEITGRLIRHDDGGIVA